MTQIDLFASLDADRTDRTSPSTRAETAERRPARSRLILAPQLSDDEMASRLEATGRYRILRQLQPRPMRSAGGADTAPIAPDPGTGLKVPSVVRFDKLATLDLEVIAGRLGEAPAAWLDAHRAAFFGVFGFAFPPSPPEPDA